MRAPGDEGPSSGWWCTSSCWLPPAAGTSSIARGETLPFSCLSVPDVSSLPFSSSSQSLFVVGGRYHERGPCTLQEAKSMTRPRVANDHYGLRNCEGA